MNGLLGFLKKANVEEVKPSERVGTVGPRKQRNPNPAIVAIRVWRDGSVFPSKAAVEKFDLEYRTAKITKDPLPLKPGETEQRYKNVYEFPEGTGNGFDVIDSREWPQFKGEGNLMFVAAVPKNAGKVDLFSSTNYDEEGKPKTTVLEQGANTFGKESLLPVLKEVYGIELGEEKDGKKEFVDLEIFESLGEGDDAVNVTEKFSKNILHVPKRITRGADKGKSDYTRREGVKVYGLAPVELLHGEQTQVPEEAAGSDEPVDLTEASAEERSQFLNA